MKPEYVFIKVIPSLLSSEVDEEVDYRKDISNGILKTDLFY